MNINELIDKLIALRQDHGNLIVEVRNREGEFDEVEAIDVAYCGQPYGPDTWRVLLDV